MKLVAVPETTTAFLPSDGLNRRRVTKHHYSHSSPATGDRGEEGIAHYFRCVETNALRRWGFE
jgi:hypothetical protein